MTDGVERLLHKLGAAGRLDSSGAFRVDLARAHQLLPKFALASPEEYILRLLAAAVEARASRFSLNLEAGALCLSWDGAPLEEEDLVRQLPGPSQGELGLGLWAARQRFRRLELLGRTHRLRLDSKELAVEPLDEPHSETSVFLYGPRWKGALGRWLPGKEERLLQQRCRLAPLRLELRGNHLPVKLDFGERDILIKVGEPPFECDHDLAIPGALGSGYLALGGDVAPDVGSPQLFGLASQTPTWAGEARPQGGRVLVIRSGVSYEPDWQPSAPLSRLLWWSDELPLDLSRSGLIEGALQQQWQQAVESWFEQALVEHLLAQPYPAGTPYLEWVLEECRSTPGSKLAEQPVFSCTDGARVSYAELARDFRRRGCLLVGHRQSSEAPGGVLWFEAMPAWELTRQFPYLVQVETELKRRLPEHGYLLKLPLSSWPGELGIRNDTLPLFRRRIDDGTWVEEEGAPYVDVACDTSPVQAGAALGSLLYTEGLPEPVRLVQVLGWALAMADKLPGGQSDRFLTLLEQLPQFEVVERGLSTSEVCRFLEEFELSSPGGPPVRLVELAREGGICHWSSNDQVMHGTHLLLSPAAAGLLARLLAPRNRVVEVHYSGPASRALAEARNCTQVLVRLAQDDQGLAYQMLSPPQRADFSRLVDHTDSPAAVKRLIEKAGEAGSLIETSSLLLALKGNCHRLEGVELTRPAPQAGRLTSEGFDFFEPAPAADAMLHAYWRTCRVWFLLRFARFDEALEQANLAVAEARRPWSLGGLAAARMLSGDPLGSLTCYEQALELSPDSAVLWTNYAEDLALVGRSEEARRAVAKALRVSPGSFQARIVKASLLLESKLEDCWKLCEQLIREADLPASVWETRALAAERLGRLDDARESWRKFLEGAWIETLLENNLPERRARAEERLARLATA